ncbi:MAG: hypothetical protein KJ811_04915, partial [Candidatus Margulisbacteria bacterium]|nr:hypothetical protein [Candidatus Margulisiibacteriota bacterium]
GIKNQKDILLNAFIFFLIGLSHGFTMVFSGVIAIFFLLTRKDFLKNFIYLFKVFGLGGLWLSFWFIPFIGNLPYVTSYVTRWHISSVWKVIPAILIPFLVISVISFLLNLFDRRTHYFAYVLTMCGLLYFAAPSLGMLDIRFVPFIQLFTLIFGATIILVFQEKLKSAEFIPFIIFLSVILWTMPQVTYIKGWIKWNYEGLEGKASYPLAQQIHNHLRAGRRGRVVYEHSPSHNVFGSERVFENLPYYAGRETLEGLYMQSSISSPFIFYIQSEVSRVHSGPFPQYKYAQLNLTPAIHHLKMFNVTQYIARSPEAKAAAKHSPQLKLEKTIEDYEIYRLTTNDGSYVEVLENKPVLFITNNWKRDFFEWFRRINLLKTHLVYLKEPSQADLQRFETQSDDLLELPQASLQLGQANISEKMGTDWLEFTTNQVGQPHLIKISYHPNWQIEGADKIYLVSPSFMLVYPNREKVRLYFGKTIYNYVGEGLTFLGIMILAGALWRSRRAQALTGGRGRDILFKKGSD